MSLKKETDEEGVVLSEDDEIDFLAAVMGRLCFRLDHTIDEFDAIAIIRDFITKPGIAYDTVDKLALELKKVRYKPQKHEIH